MQGILNNMTDIAIKNLGIISTLVENHFGLDDESLEYFKHKIFNPSIPEEISPHLDEDFRYN